MDLVVFRLQSLLARNKGKRTFRARFSNLNNGDFFTSCDVGWPHCQPPPPPANQNIAHNIPLQTYKLPTGNHSQSQKLPSQMSQNGGTHVPPQYPSQPHPEPFSAHTHHCEPPTDPIMEYEPTPSNIPDQRVELSPRGMVIYICLKLNQCNKVKGILVGLH